MRQSGWPQVAGVLAGAVLAVWFGGASAQQPQFGATVARVRVDVIVTDEDGDFVEDLTAGNFRLFEDGKRQEISRRPARGPRRPPNCGPGRTP